MTIPITLSLLAGTATGITAGLIPGLHTNNIAPVLITAPLIHPGLFAFMASAAAGFTVSSHVPSILLGAPSGGNIAVLPGHKLTNAGKGITAISLALKGTFTSILATPILAFLFILLAPELYPPLSQILPFILVLVTLLVIKKPQGILIAVLSAALGLTVLNGNTIMPMLTGFFGTSTLIISLTRDKKIKKQDLKSKPESKPCKTTRSAALSTALSGFFGAIPAVSSAITATVGKAFGKMNKEEYLSFIGASNATYITVSLLALVTLGKTRSGTTVALAATKFPQDPFTTTLILITSLSISYITIKLLLPKIAKTMNKLNHKKLTMTALCFLVLLNVYLTNMQGLLVLLISTSIGIATVKLKASRINCMASLTIPTALLLL